MCIHTMRIHHWHTRARCSTFVKQTKCTVEILYEVIHYIDDEMHSLVMPKRVMLHYFCTRYMCLTCEMSFA
jgi:hypothetical protein